VAASDIPAHEVSQQSKKLAGFHRPKVIAMRSVDLCVPPAAIVELRSSALFESAHHGVRRVVDEVVEAEVRARLLSALVTVLP